MGQEMTTDRATDDQIAEWHAHLEDDSTTPDAIVLADALESVLRELNAERNRWFEAMTRMECETGCGNCNVCRLQATIHVRAGQLQKQREILRVAREWARWFAAERDYLRREVAKDYAAIAEKQKRDNARIAELEAALEAKTAQHAETLGLLEHAYGVIEAQNRPPLGYLALSCTEDRLIPGAYHYTAACPITESILPAERFVEEHAKRRKRYIVAELREVSG